jgi:hypothetical protein
MLLNNTATASIEKQVDNSFASINAKINKQIALRTATSSNPYDYVRDNPDFENIIVLGSDALPSLQNKLLNNPDSGLHEYILAIAIETIAKVDLKKNESTMWESAKMFKAKWPEYLTSIPALVETITSDQSLESEKKVNKLVELGTPAVPFILEIIEIGDEQLFPAIIALTKDTENVTTENADPKEWVAQNKAKFANLKQYVLNQ